VPFKCSEDEDTFGHAASDFCRAMAIARCKRSCKTSFDGKTVQYSATRMSSCLRKKRNTTKLSYIYEVPAMLKTTVHKDNDMF